MSTREKEIVIIAKIGDFEAFKQASYTQAQDQLELFFPGKGRMRKRRTVDENGTAYTECIKTASDPTKTIKDVEEAEDPTTAKMFEAFRNIAETLQIKTRYTFEGEKSVIVSNNETINLPPIKYEVDVFKRADGRTSEWCKIDIELNSFLEAMKSVEGMGEEDLNLTIKVTHLPFKPQMAFMVGDCTDEQKQALSELWANEWTQTPFGESRNEPKASVSELPAVPQQPQEPATEADNDQTHKEGV